MEFPNTPSLTTIPQPSWMAPFRNTLTSAASWSVYTDASWKAAHPIQAQALFGLQGTHLGWGALFLSADSPDWCSHILAVQFKIPPTHRALGGTSAAANSAGSWQLSGLEGTHPLGSVRATLSYHRVLAYRSNRDSVRSRRGAPPIWLDSYQSFGAALWLARSQPLRKQALALCTLCEFHWHGENKAVASHSHDPQVSA